MIEIDAVLVEATSMWWRRALRASLHPDLITLATTSEDDAYLVRPMGGAVEALGLIPTADWRDEHHHERPAIVPEGLTWLLCSDDLLHDLYPYGAWYVQQDGPEGGATSNTPRTMSGPWRSSSRQPKARHSWNNRGHWAGYLA